MSAITKWVSLAGNWTFQGTSAIYEGPSDPNSPVPHGMAICEPTFRSGEAVSTVRFENPTRDTAGRILFGYNHTTGANYSAGIGGYGYSHVLVELVPSFGWVARQTAGSSSNIAKDTDYEVRVRLRGQRIQLVTDKIKIIDTNLPHPLLGDAFGLFAWGTSRVIFDNIDLTPAKPKAFVVMPFGEPYDSLYKEVIHKVCEAKDFNDFRADDVYRPGIILQDIIQGITESEVIIAEISSQNPNVFYEIGYAHAFGKATILLVERKGEIPFDIRSYRCIFYDDTIKGKADIEDKLGKHLDSIKGSI